MVKKILLQNSPSKKVHLEEFNVHHAKHIFSILDKEVGESVGWSLKKNAKEFEKYLERDNLKLWSIFLNNVLIGCIFLDLKIKEDNVWSQHTGNLGYFIDENFRGNGCISISVPWVIKYAFNTLCLKRLIAGCLENNKVSKHIIENNGFKLIGVERNYAKPKSSNKYLKHYFYDLIPEDL